MLHASQGAVKAALHRARAALAAVRNELDRPSLPLPEDEQTKLFLHAIAAAYRKGDAAYLIRLALCESAEAAYAADLLHNAAIKKLSPAKGLSQRMRMAA